MAAAKGPVLLDARAQTSAHTPLAAAACSRGLLADVVFWSARRYSSSVGTTTVAALQAYTSPNSIQVSHIREVWYAAVSYTLEQTYGSGLATNREQKPLAWHSSAKCGVNPYLCGAKDTSPSPCCPVGLADVDIADVAPAAPAAAPPAAEERTTPEAAATSNGST